MIVNRNADVSGSMIIRSTKLTVIISLSYLNCDSTISVIDHRKRQKCGDCGPSQQSQPEEIQQRPKEKKGCLGREVKLSRSHDGERGKMKDGDDNERQCIAARDRLGGRKTTKQS